MPHVLVNLKEPQFWFGLLSAIIIFLSQIAYMINVAQKKVIPSILSWGGWSILMGTSLISILFKEGWEWRSATLLLSSFCCLIVFFIALRFRNFSLNKKDWNFLILGLLCIGSFLVFKTAWLTVGLAILADFVLGIPTILKAYNDPYTEKSITWPLGLLAWAITLVMCIVYTCSFASVLFPVYLFSFNGVMVYLTTFKPYIKGLFPLIVKKGE